MGMTGRWIAGFAVGFATAVTSGANEPLVANAALVADVEAIVPGQSFTVALHLTMPRDAYVYWRNPGDAGLPTSMRWTLPDGFEVGAIEWPVPGIFDEEPLRSFGYKQEVLLPVRIQAPGNLDPETGTVELAVRADWLICREACVPGSALLRLALDVAREPRADAAGAARIAAWREKVPTPDERWSGHMASATGTVTLTVTPPQDFRLPPQASVVFLPYTEGVIEPAAAQRFRRSGGVWELTLTRDVMRVDPGASLRGLLRIDTPNGLHHIVEIELPRENETSRRS